MILDYGFRFSLTVGTFPLIFAAFAAAVVQDDPVGSGAALWQTSPISGPAMLGAKALFLGIFLCAIPVAIHVQWVESLAGGGEIPGMVLDSLLFQGGLLIIVSLGASLTPNLGAFLVLATSAWVGLEMLYSGL